MFGNAIGQEIHVVGIERRIEEEDGITEGNNRV